MQIAVTYLEIGIEGMGCLSLNALTAEILEARITIPAKRQFYKTDNWQTDIAFWAYGNLKIDYTNSDITALAAMIKQSGI